MNGIKYIGQMSSSQNSRVIDPEGISYAVTNGEKDGEPKIIERDTPMKGNHTEPRICTMVGRDPNNPKSRKKADGYVQMLEIGDDVSNTLTSVHPNSHALEFKGEKSIKTDVSPALRATDYKAPHCVWEDSVNYRIRKLTPKECFRLMGVSEGDIEKIQNSGVSQTQQYKMAGNSIVVDVLEHIFRKLFVDTGQESQQLLLF